MNESMPRRNAGSGTRSQVREKASVLARGVKEQARVQYDERKNIAVGELGTLASHLRNVADEMRSENPDNVTGRLVSTLADRIESFGQSLEGKDLDTLLTDVEQFARRNPAAFLGGAAAVGFLASRFLKSSAAPVSRDSWEGAHMMSDYGDRTDSPVASSGYTGGAMPTSSMSSSDSSPAGSVKPRARTASGRSRGSGKSSRAVTTNANGDLSGGRK
jgi:hypothetical protein